MNPTENWTQLLRKVSSSCSTSGTRSVAPVTNPYDKWNISVVILYVSYLQTPEFTPPFLLIGSVWFILFIFYVVFFVLFVFVLCLVDNVAVSLDC
jgi:hypothetical protein